MCKNNNKGSQSSVVCRKGTKKKQHAAWFETHLRSEQLFTWLFVYEKLTQWERSQITEKISQSKHVFSKAPFRICCEEVVIVSAGATKDPWVGQVLVMRTGSNLSREKLRKQGAFDLLSSFVFIVRDLAWRWIVGLPLWAYSCQVVNNSSSLAPSGRGTPVMHFNQTGCAY